MRKTNFTWAIEMQLVRYEHAEDGCCVGEARSDIDTVIILDTKEEANRLYPLVRGGAWCKAQSEIESDGGER